MSIKAVLFDLDGTLLPMDQDYFVKHIWGYWENVLRLAAMNLKNLQKSCGQELGSW